MQTLPAAEATLGCIAIYGLDRRNIVPINIKLQWIAPLAFDCLIYLIAPFVVTVIFPSHASLDSIIYQLSEFLIFITS
jgi:hypothetical protein